MTIIFLSRLFYPHIGGVEKHVLEVGKRLVKKGHRVIVVTEEYQSKDSSAKTTGEVEGFEIHRISKKRDSGLAESDSARQNDGRGVAVKKNWLKKFKIWWWLWMHKDLIEKADIVHCHDVFFWYLPFRFLYPNKKVFTTFHGYETKFPPSKKSILIRKISEKLSWGNICVGDYIKKWYGTKLAFVTYGGVEIDNSPHPNPLPRGEREMGEGESSKLKILFIGRLEGDTGILIYLKALEILEEKKINFEFEACGDGSLRSKVEQYGKVHGFVEDLGVYLKKTDVVFASSYLSILEAMRYKKLAFAVYDNPLKEDYLKMAPFAKWIVIENNAENIVKNILYYSTHLKERNEKINEGFQWVKNQSWDKVVQLYVRLWNK